MFKNYVFQCKIMLFFLNRNEVILNDWRRLQPITCRYELFYPIKGLATYIRLSSSMIFFFFSVVESPGKKPLLDRGSRRSSLLSFSHPPKLFWTEWNVTFSVNGSCSVVSEPAEAPVDTQSRCYSGTCSFSRLQHRRRRWEVVGKREGICRVESSNTFLQKAKWERILH